MHYYSMGNIPPKRHTQFRKPDGSLYHEELFSTEGFSDLYSTLYRCNPPTQIVQVGAPRSVAAETIHDQQLKHRSLKGFRIAPAEKDPETGAVKLWRFQSKAHIEAQEQRRAARNASLSSHPV